MRRFVARLGGEDAGASFERMECGPGEEVQVDFGQGAFIVDGDGKRRRPHVFRIVLSHSAQRIQRSRTKTNYRCVFDVPGERRLQHFLGGVPARGTFDNLPAAVLGTRIGSIRNCIRKMQVCFGALRLRVSADQTADAQTHGGRAERGVDSTVQENAFKGHTFTMICTLRNDHLYPV